MEIKNSNIIKTKQVKFGGYNYFLDANNLVLMNERDYTEWKIRLIYEYYFRAIEIFGRNSHERLKKGILGYSHIVDLFCGSGLYGNGIIGSPLAILEAYLDVIDLYDYCVDRIKFHFNDATPEIIESLKKRIKIDPRYSTLLPLISFTNFKHSKAIKSIEKTIEGQNNGIVSYFVDPYSYKPINLELLKQLNGPYRELIVNWIVQFPARHIDSPELPGYKYLEKLLPLGAMSILQAEETLEEKVVKALELLRTLLKNEKIVDYSPAVYFIKEDQRTWYSIIHLSNDYTAKMTFDAAKSKTTQYLGVVNPKLLSSSSVSSFLDGISPETENYILLTENLAAQIHILLNQVGPLTIREIKEKLSKINPDNPVRGYKGHPMRWVREILPKAIKNYPCIKFDTPIIKRNSIFIHDNQDCL